MHPFFLRLRKPACLCHPILNLHLDYTVNALLSLSISAVLSVQSRCVKRMYYIRPRCSPSALCYLFWQVLWRYLFGWKKGAQHQSRAATGLDHQLVPLLLVSFTKPTPHSLHFYQRHYPVLTSDSEKNLREEPVPPPPCIWKDKITTRLG